MDTRADRHGESAYINRSTYGNDYEYVIGNGTENVAKGGKTTFRFVFVYLLYQLRLTIRVLFWHDTSIHGINVTYKMNKKPISDRMKKKSIKKLKGKKVSGGGHTYPPSPAFSS